MCVVVIGVVFMGVVVVIVFGVFVFVVFVIFGFGIIFGGICCRCGWGYGLDVFGGYVFVYVFLVGEDIGF